MLRYILISLLSVLACACARSTGLTSNDLDCALGERVFTRNAGHCVYFIDDAPDECPSVAAFRYRVGDYIICGGLEELSPQWLVAILDEAYPPEQDAPDAILFTDGALVGTAISSDGSLMDPTLSNDAESPISMSDAGVASDAVSPAP